MIDSVVDLLRCPLCTLPLAVQQQAVRCPAGHGFDVARQGYVNLLTRPVKGANADTTDMIAARHRFLSAGHYEPLAVRIAEAAAAMLPADSAVLEAGAGTGYYLARVVTQISANRGIATDLSAAACRRAARVDDRIGAVVADTWAGLPIKDSAVDLIMVIFAPRNPSDFARLLRPGGRLLIVTANDDHLVQLRDRLGMIDIQPGKVRALQQSLQPLFDLQHRDELRSELRLDHPTLADLLLMGPNAHHLAADVRTRIAALPDPAEVTLSVTMSIFARR